MVDVTDTQCVHAYRKHKHLHRAADELGMSWQTLYVRLRRVNEPVTGDKSCYGAPKDKLAALGEQMFSDLVPFAKNNNEKQFQPKIDFDVMGMGVDVKTSKRTAHSKKFKSERLAFSFKKQSNICDFFVCIALCPDKKMERVFLFPGDMIGNKQTVSIPVSMKSKWSRFEVHPDSLEDFFRQMGEAKNAA